MELISSLEDYCLIRDGALRLVVVLVLIGFAACSPSDKAVVKSDSAERAATPDLKQLFGRIWQVADAPSKPAPGGIYVFLANGTLLETSCVETYRIATWSIDPKQPFVLRAFEDKQLAFTAVITQVTQDTLRLRQNLPRSNESRMLTLKAIEEELVCPDLRR